jgi:hypothetical protein
VVQGTNRRISVAERASVWRISLHITKAGWLQLPKMWDYRPIMAKFMGIAGTLWLMVVGVVIGVKSRA